MWGVEATVAPLGSPWPPNLKTNKHEVTPTTNRHYETCFSFAQLTIRRSFPPKVTRPLEIEEREHFLMDDDHKFAQITLPCNSCSPLSRWHSRLTPAQYCHPHMSQFSPWLSLYLPHRPLTADKKLTSDNSGTLTTHSQGRRRQSILRNPSLKCLIRKERCFSTWWKV